MGKLSKISVRIISMGTALCALGACEPGAPALDASDLGNADLASFDAAWVPPVNTAISLEVGSQAEADAVLAVGAPGALGTPIVAAWMSLRDRGTIAAARSEDGGQTWRSLGAVPLPDGAFAVDPSLAIDAIGGFHLGYQVESSSVRSVWQVPIAETYGVPVEVTVPGAAPRRDAPWLTALSTGELIAVYSERPVGLGDRLVVARSTDLGASFSHAEIPGSDGEVPIAVATAQGGLFVASSDAARHVRHHWSPDGGVTFEAATASLGTIVRETRPALTVLGARVLLGFARGGDAALALLRFEDGALLDERDLDVAPSAIAFLHPVLLARPPGRVTIAFYATDDGESGAWRISSSEDGGAHFAPSVIVSDRSFQYTPDRAWPSWLGDYEALAYLPDGELLTAWTDNRDGPSHVYLARGLP